MVRTARAKQRGFALLFGCALACACGGSSSEEGMRPDAGAHRDATVDVRVSRDAARESARDALREAPVDARSGRDAGAGDARSDATDAAPLLVPPLATLDGYGGAIELPIPNTSGYFRVAKAYGRDWLVTPDGHAFVSMGVNNVNPTGDTDQSTGQNPYGEWVSAHYPSQAAWADAAVSRMSAWTFNTIGAWSTFSLFPGRMPEAPVLSFADPGWNVGSGPDVFDPAWVAASMASAVTQIGAEANDPYVIGWFLDNELRWGPDWRSSSDLCDAFVALPSTAPGKAALVAYAQSFFGGDVTAFNAAFGTSLASFADLASTTSLPSTTSQTSPAAMFRHAWTGQVADQYFQVASAAVRAADPNHLVLGCRFVSWLAPPSVVEAAGRHVDVVSVNHYEISAAGQALVTTTPQFAYSTSTADWLTGFALLSGRPILISEFGARAADSGLPNTYPPPLFQVVWATQADRADALERYGRALAEQSYLVGIHWFEWVDEPPGGRTGDGENSNWGLVNASDVPYAAVVARAPLVGPMLAYALAADAGR